MICEEFRETLEQEGYQVDCALNGKEGLQKLQTNRYHLVFIDFAMPFMDGKKVLERMRHFSRVPVAVITGFISAAKEKEILSLGAITCLKKPLDLDRVKSIIRTIENKGTSISAASLQGPRRGGSSSLP